MRGMNGSSCVGWIVLSALFGVSAAYGQTSAEAILDSVQNETAFCVVLGCGDGRLAAALARDGKLLVHGLGLDQASVEKARQDLHAQKIYGQATVEQLRGRSLPHADNLVNVVVAENWPAVSRAGVSLSEVMRVVCPNGMLFVSGIAAAELKGHSKSVESVGRWMRAIKPQPKEMDEWTHNRQYDAEGTAVSKDTALRPVNSLRWQAGPYMPLGGLGFLAFRNSNKGLVSAAGRNIYVTSNDSSNLFRVAGRAYKRQTEQPHVYDAEKWWVFVARDAYNGLKLWSHSLVEYAEEMGIATGEKTTNPSRHALALGPALVAVKDRVYGVVYGNVVAIDAVTGKLVKVYEKGTSPACLVYSRGVLFVAGGPRRKGSTWSVRAIDPETGSQKWKYESNSNKIVISDGQVLVGTSRTLVALDEETGHEKWKQDISSLKGGWYDRILMYAKAGVVVLGYGTKSNRGGIRGHHVLSAKDGKYLWSHETEARKADPHIARLADGLIWYNRRNPEVKSRRDPKATILEGRDPLTGEVKRKFISSKESVLNIWGGICRNGRPMATEHLLIGSRSICLTDVKQGKSYGFPGRHACGIGVLPANGLLYSLPHACKCSAGGVRGFLAASNDPLPDEEKAKAVGPDRLIKGPAYKRDKKSDVKAQPANDWPTFRHDARRSGSTKAKVPPDLRAVWDVRVNHQIVTNARLEEEWVLNSLGGDRLTPPSVAGGMVFVSAVEANQVIALDAQTGKERWRYTVGGRLDTPPSIHNGLCLAGSHDGWVYCLRAKDGQLVWRFLAAPEDRRMMAHGQIESLWPVVGGVLINEGLACFAAGRNAARELAGGLYYYALDPQTGRVEGTAKAISWRAYDNNILVGVGGTVLGPNGSLTLSSKGGRGRPPKDDFGYFTMPGRYGNSNRIFNRTWHWPAARRPGTAGGTRWGHPQGFWNVTGLLAVGIPDQKKAVVFAFPRTRDYELLEREGGDITFWEEDPSATPESILKEIERRFPEAGAKSGKYSTENVVKGSFGDAAKIKMKMKWHAKVPGPSQVESLILAGDLIFAGGPLDRFDRKKGGFVRAYSAADGKMVGEIKLSSPPVSEGLAAVEGRLYVAAQDGKVLCFGKK